MLQLLFEVVGAAGEVSLVYLNVVLVFVDAVESHHGFPVVIVVVVIVF